MEAIEPGVAATLLARGVFRLGSALGRLLPVNGGARDSALHHSTHIIEPEFMAARAGRPLALVLFGFSRFEEFAEHSGAVATSDAIREFNRILERTARPLKLDARSGWRGDSFLVSLPGATFEDAMHFVHEVRKAAAASAVRMPGFDAGISTFGRQVETPDALVRAAERALTAARAASPGGRPTSGAADADRSARRHRAAVAAGM